MLLLFTISAIACDQVSVTPTDTVSETNSEGSSAASSEPEIIQDLGGYKFTWATIWSWANYPEQGASEYGDKRLESYERIQKQYNCVIESTTLNAVTFNTDLAMAVASGDKYYDFFQVDYPRYQAIYKSLKDLSSVSSIDVNDKKYIETATRFFSQEGEVHALCYDYQRMPLGYLLFYNKTLIEANQLDDPYTLVKDGEWTFDKFAEICKGLTKSTSGGAINQWGFSGVDWNAASIELPFVYSNGGKVIKKNDADRWVYAMLDNEAQEALNYLHQLIYVDKTLVSSSGNDLFAGLNEWLAGKAGFFIGTADYLYSIGGENSKIREDIEWGIVPMPVGPSADDFLLMATDGLGWAMMETNPDFEKAAIIFDAISDPVYDSVEEDKIEYFDTLTNSLLQGSEEMAEMYQLCAEKIVPHEAGGVGGVPESVGAAVYECVRSVEYTPRAAMEAIAGNVEWYIEVFFYGDEETSETSE
jgi:hypothetical protein